jgi:hypothetical protein
MFVPSSRVRDLVAEKRQVPGLRHVVAERHADEATGVVSQPGNVRRGYRLCRIKQVCFTLAVLVVVNEYRLSGSEGSDRSVYRVIRPALDSLWDVAT